MLGGIPGKSVDGGKKSMVVGADVGVLPSAKLRLLISIAAVGSIVVAADVAKGKKSMVVAYVVGAEFSPSFCPITLS
jgi:hypothetical protein